jgi:N-acetylneuraminic acid mutarotase
MKITTTIILFLCCCVCSMQGQKGFWTELKPENSPSQRWAFGMCDIGEGKVMIFGGGDSTGSELNETWIYNLDSNNWRQVITNVKPKGRVRLGLARLSKNKVILFGGTLNDFSRFNDTWIFDIETETWEEIFPSRVPLSRYGHSISHLSDNKVIIFSGEGTSIDGDPFADDTWIFDYEKNTWDSLTLGNSPVDCEESMMAILDTGFVFLFGGARGSPMNQNYIYNSKWWKKLQPLSLPPATCSGGMVNLEKNILFLWGGYTLIPPYYLSDEAWLYNYNQNNWTKINVELTPPRRFYHQIAKIEENKIILFGGYDLITSIGYNDTWLFTYEPNNIQEEHINSDVLNVKLIQQGNEYITLDCNLIKPSFLLIEIIDVTGRLYYEYKSEFEAEGIFQKLISINDLSNGIYFINFTADTINKQIKFIILK